MKTFASLTLIILVFTLSSGTLKKEAYAFKYFKTEIHKNDKLKSFEWGTKDQTLTVNQLEEGVEVILGDDIYKCIPFEVKDHLKGTTGTSMINGVEKTCKIIVYKSESTTVPQVKITVYEDSKMIVTKFWYSLPGNFEMK